MAEQALFDIVENMANHIDILHAKNVKYESQVETLSKDLAQARNSYQELEARLSQIAQENENNRQLQQQQQHQHLQQQQQQVVATAIPVVAAQVVPPQAALIHHHQQPQQQQPINHQQPQQQQSPSIQPVGPPQPPAPQLAPQPAQILPWYNANGHAMQNSFYDQHGTIVYAYQQP